MLKHHNREDWLNAAISSIRPFFESEGHALPAKIRASCGFPSTFRRSGTTAEFFRDTSSADGTFEILISPTLADPVQVWNALWQCCAGMACYGGIENTGMDSLIADLGDYPHAAITVDTRPAQTTRMLKATCPTCGMIIRLTQRWASTPPVCSADGADFVVELPGATA